MSVYIEVTKHWMKCHLQAWKSLVLLEKAFKILKTMLVFKSNFTMHGLRKHLPSTFEYLETIPQINNNGHIFYFVCYLICIFNSSEHSTLLFLVYTWTCYLYFSKIIFIAFVLFLLTFSLIMNLWDFTELGRSMYNWSSHEWL